MPRNSRIDAPGGLHHIIARGIDREQIFDDDADRDNFLDRLGNILSEIQTVCFAQALIPNHRRKRILSVNIDCHQRKSAFSMWSIELPGCWK
jgi:hypothetical protein